MQYYCGAEGFLNGLPGNVEISENALFNTVCLVRERIDSVARNEKFLDHARELMTYSRQQYVLKQKVGTVR